MYKCNSTNNIFHNEIETSLLYFVEHGDKEKLLNRIKFYSEMEEIIKKYNTNYFIRILDSNLDSVEFEISLDYFL